MTRYRRMLRSADGIVLSKEVRESGCGIVESYHVTSRAMSEPRLFADLAEAESFFEEEALRLLTPTQWE
jgi:hypothetical protein